MSEVTRYVVVYRVVIVIPIYSAGKLIFPNVSWTKKKKYFSLLMISDPTTGDYG